MMELSDIRAFVRVADLGSLSQAARALAVPKSTVSRSLSRLEATVGAILLDRSPRHLRLTEAGLLFRPHAARILADVEEAGTAMDGFVGTPRGTLRVSAPFTLAMTLVAPMTPGFLARHPEVQLLLDVEDRVVDLPVEAVDLAIRVGPLPDSGLIARRLMSTEMWTCASPAYLAAHGAPGQVADLASHALIAGLTRPAAWSYTAPGGEAERLEVRPRNAICEPMSLRQVLVGGAGIGRLPDFVAAEAVARRELVRLLPGLTGDTFDVHAMYTSHRSLSAKVRAFIDALVEHLAAGTELGTRTIVEAPRRR
jgi:DNA-binding transcriptional LysR family regulator